MGATDGPGGAAGAGLTVVVVERRLYEDGAARSSLRLVQRWAAAGARVHLYVLERTSEHRPGAPLPAGVVPVHPTLHRELRLRWTLPWGLLRLLPMARRADVVVSGREIGWGVLIGRVAAWATRRPFVVMIRSQPQAAIEQYVGPRARPAMRAALRTADRLVCIAPGLVPAVEGLGVHPDKISVVLNGVEVEAIRTAAATVPPHLPDGEGPLVVGIGRLTRQKGFDLLVRAHARVIAAGVPHRLLLLGDGQQHEELRRLAEDLGVSATVHMPGFTADPIPILAAADLYCLPSRWEGFGQTLAEALIVGTPVIAADCVAGPRDLLDGGSRGDLVPVDDVDALARAMERHLRDPQRLRAAAEAGRSWASANLDVQRSADEVLEVLREVVAAARR